MVTTTSATKSQSVSQTSPQPPPLKLPKAWKPGAAHRPPLAIWERLREDLFKHSGATPKHKATMADVDRVIARAEKNGVSPGELLALTSIKSTQHPYFEGGSDSAAWQKLNNWTLAQRSGPTLQGRVDGEVKRLAAKGPIDVAGAEKLMAWVRAENSVPGAQALLKSLAANGSKFTPDAKKVLAAFLAATPVR
jgi:hypothetical protein